MFEDSRATVTTVIICLALLWTSSALWAQPVLEEERKLTDSDAATGDEFGHSLSLSGDTLIVGSRLDDNPDAGMGSVSIFQRDEGGPDAWGQVTKFSGTDVEQADHFGSSLALSGDTVVVGSPNDSNALYVSQGSAYLFERDQGGTNSWGLVKKIEASDGEGLDHFGISVAIDGDTAVVGAYGNDGATLGAGAAYVFERNAGGIDNWGQTKKLLASDAASADDFGIRVSISGDTIVIAARRNDSSDVDAGAAYVFERNLGGPSSWGERTKLFPPDGANDDRFGESVAIDTDTIVVGSYRDDDGGANSGSAYVFERNLGGTDNWGQARKLMASDAAADDNFGNSCFIDGDTILVGSIEDDDLGVGSGSAYVFSRNSGGAGLWGQVAKLTSSDAAAGDAFGSSLAMENSTVFVGAQSDDDSGVSSGSVYLFGESSTPSLSIPATLAAAYNQPVDVPINFAGEAIAATAFSIDIDESCLGFDPTDSNSDGIPDDVSFAVPAAFTPSVSYAAGDVSGEFDFVIADYSAPLAALAEGVIVTLTVTPSCEPVASSILAPVAFATTPAPSFGNTSGQSVPGISQSGVVEILPGLAGDCNGDELVDAGDLSACVLEVFDGDGTFWTDVAGGTFPGSPVGCDANQDESVDAGDLSCKILLIFNGPGACGASLTSPDSGNPELQIGEVAGAGVGEDVQVPLTFSGRGRLLSAGSFALDYDETCLQFDSNDADGDGVPDALALSLPAGIATSIDVVSGGIGGQIRLAFFDPILPLLAIPDGVLAQLKFTQLCDGDLFEAPVRFGEAAPLSFGDTTGQGVEAVGIDGGVWIGAFVFEDSFETGDLSNWSITVP